MESSLIIDIVTLVPILILVGALFYFSNREMKQSLEQSAKAQKLLSEDRTILIQKLIESQKEVRESRLARLDELEKAAEFGRLSQGLFHDLMTPLTSLVLQTEKMKNSGSIPNIEKAMEASRRMTLYIKDIRATLAREEESRECDAREELQKVVHLFEYAAREKSVSFSITEKTKQIWKGNPVKLRQIFSNLISNALDAFESCTAQEKEIKITLDANPKHAIIQFKDNGCGIPPENLSHIFEPFFTTKALDKGTGIGLTTVKSTVEKILHGKIEVQSEMGRGTLFTITFPTQYTNPAAYPPPPHTPPHPVKSS